MYKRRNQKQRNQAIKLSWQDKNELLNNFPKMELSYEKLIHKKFSSIQGNNTYILIYT